MKRTLAEAALLVEAGSLDAMATTKKVSKRPQTRNAGASLNRQNTVRWVKDNWPFTKEMILNYLKGQTGRANAKPGGLGKEKKR